MVFREGVHVEVHSRVGHPGHPHHLLVLSHRGQPETVIVGAEFHAEGGPAFLPLSISDLDLFLEIVWRFGEDLSFFGVLLCELRKFKVVDINAGISLFGVGSTLPGGFLRIDTAHFQLNIK